MVDNKSVKLQTMDLELMTGAEYKEYILAECKRQWADNQAAEYGDWEKQPIKIKNDYYNEMYDNYADLLGKCCQDCRHSVAYNEKFICKCSHSITYKAETEARNYCENWESV